MSEMNVFNTPEAKETAEELLKVFAQRMEHRQRLIVQRLDHDIEVFFWDNLENMIKMASEVWEKYQTGKFEEGRIYAFLVSQTPLWIDYVWGVYRDGCVYLGLSPADAVTEDVCRINNGLIELSEKKNGEYRVFKVSF